MKRYEGRRWPRGCSVIVHQPDGDAKELDPRHDLVNHSPTGFEWGYHGSGPAQLALAILADHFASHPDDVTRVVDAITADYAALRLHQRFKSAVVGSLPTQGFELTSDNVSHWIAALCE